MAQLSALSLTVAQQACPLPKKIFDPPFLLALQDGVPILHPEKNLMKPPFFLVSLKAKQPVHQSAS
jgi:hypothetical protein